MGTTTRHASRHLPGSPHAHAGDGSSILRSIAAWLVSVAESALGQCALPTPSTTIEIDALSRRLSDTRRRLAEISRRGNVPGGGANLPGGSAFRPSRKRKSAPSTSR